jgi:hypothetical protein
MRKKCSRVASHGPLEAGTDPAARCFLRRHELFDGLDEILDRGIVRLPVVLQLVDFGRETLV